MKPENDRAFKEWDVVVRSMERGETILLIRKGGITEEGGSFRVDESEFFLFPNHTHQNAMQLQPRAHPMLEVSEAERTEEGTVRISSYAEVAGVWVVPDEAALARLDAEHLWSRDYLLERLRYKPRDPLYAIALRVYVLPEPITIPYLSAYGGCTSWITLERPLPTAGAVPALDDTGFRRSLAAVSSLIEAI